ncbi:MAG: DUF3800 domain-containing protein [Thermohalobaculum sp.]|nr:DUF3800 domain-containing protein [Thermohalobaculum sp.]
MYLLYLDDSGSPGNRDERYFVLAGVCIFERQVHWLSRNLDDLAARLGHVEPAKLEFHASEILAGRKGSFWRQYGNVEARRGVLRQGLAAFRSLSNDTCLFGAVIDKASAYPEDPVELAFEEICRRFDHFLRRQFLGGNAQRGLLILDKHKSESRLQALAAEFRDAGHRWGVLRNLADVPFFVDSQVTRGIQFADMVAYALRRKFESGDSEFFNVIDDAFDAEGGVVHGLLHKKAPGTLCDCPYCQTRGRLL